MNMEDKDNEHIAEDHFNIEDELEFLKSFLPSVMSEGPIIVTLKKTDTQIEDFKLLLTLEADKVNLSTKPDDQLGGVWAWCIPVERWWHLKYDSIDAFETWPPLKD
jgi:hypothetical protein